jgi:hypothetical protein
MKKGLGSGSISHRYGSGNLDPDFQNWCEIKFTKILTFHMYSVGASTVGFAKKILSEDNF